MKKLIILFFIPCIGYVQYSKKEINNLLLTSELVLSTGMCEGTMDYLQFHGKTNTKIMIIYREQDFTQHIT